MDLSALALQTLLANIRDLESRSTHEFSFLAFYPLLYNQITLRFLGSASKFTHT